MGRSKKGGQFEREFAKRLGLWWTDGDRDDVFWRSSNSGGRATIRARSGKGTFGQAGDIAATDPIGLPLLKVMTLELKRGYPQSSVGNTLDQPTKGASTQFELFCDQARSSAELNQSLSWTLIQKRDRKQTLLWMPRVLADELRKVGMICPPFSLRLSKSIKIPAVRKKGKLKKKAQVNPPLGRVYGMLLDSFFLDVYPDDIKEIAKRV